MHTEKSEHRDSSWEWRVQKASARVLRGEKAIVTKVPRSQGGRATIRAVSALAAHLKDTEPHLHIFTTCGGARRKIKLSHPRARARGSTSSVFGVAVSSSRLVRPFGHHDLTRASAERDSLNKAEILVRQDFVIQAHASFFFKQEMISQLVDPL